MAPKISTFKDRANAFESLALEDLLYNRNRGIFEHKLYNRGIDESSKKYFKYPLELMSDDAHKGAMVIEIYDTNPTLLETKRNVFSIQNAEAASEMRRLKDEARAKAERDAYRQVGTNPNGSPIYQKVKDVVVDVDPKSYTDIGGRVLSTLAGAGSVYAQTALGVLVDGELYPQISGDIQNLRNSFTEEATGVGGGTSLVQERIYLYIPNNIEAGYGFEYETKNMSALDVMKLGKAIVEDGGEEAANAIGRKLAMTNMKILDDIASSLPLGIEGGTLGKFLEASTRQVVNPMQLHLFKEVKRRQFSFAYTFLPKSREELMNCYAIINTFKYYAHPATSGAGRFLDYPAEFNIKFVYGDKINKYMPFIFKCALTGIKVKYGEDSVMSTFEEDSMGVAPTKIQLELSFDELEILTRDRFNISTFDQLNP